MARRCDICGKGSLVGNIVSHANNRTKKRSFPNVHSHTVILHGRVERLNVCTRCLRSSLVQKA